MMQTRALGQCSAQASARSRTIEALVLKRSSLVMPVWCMHALGVNERCMHALSVNERCMHASSVNERCMHACIRQKH